MYVCFLQASGERVNLTIARPGKPQPGNTIRESGTQSSSQQPAQPLCYSRPSSHKVRHLVGVLIHPPSKDHDYKLVKFKWGLFFCLENATWEFGMWNVYVLLPWRVSVLRQFLSQWGWFLSGDVPLPGDSWEVFDLPEESSIYLVLLERGICLGLLVEMQQLVMWLKRHKEGSDTQVCA